MHKSWQDKRSGWTRRVTWFYITGRHSTSTRLKFEERDPATEKRNKAWRIYESEDEATKDWESFKAGELTYDKIMEEDF